MFGDVQIASMGFLFLFLLKVAGGEDSECNVRIESTNPMSLNFIPREPDRTSSLWSIPRMTLSPAIKRAVIDLQRSSAKVALGLGLGQSSTSLKYLQC